MAERVNLTEELIERDYHDLIARAIRAMNLEHNYHQAYDLAAQAKLLAERYLRDDLCIIESERIRGMAYLSIDPMVGHDIIERLYYENKNKLKDSKNQLMKVEMALGASKRIIGEYDEAIQIFTNIYKYAQREIELNRDELLDVTEEMRTIIRCYVEVSCCLIYKSQQRNYYSRVKDVEDKLKNLSDEKFELTKDMHKYLEIPNYTAEPNHDLEEAERFLKEALLMCRQNGFRDLELFGLLDYACILIEKEEFDEALEILDMMKEEPFSQEYLFGYIMDEIGIIYVHQERYEEAKDIFDRAWSWLCTHNDTNEMSRNCYGTALYFFHNGNLDLAYAFAELGYKRDQNLPSLKLLYEICLLKYISAQRLGNESEYAFYRSEYDRYKQQLERRG